MIIHTAQCTNKLRPNIISCVSLLRGKNYSYLLIIITLVLLGTYVWLLLTLIKLEPWMSTISSRFKSIWNAPKFIKIVLVNASVKQIQFGGYCFVLLNFVLLFFVNWSWKLRQQFQLQMTKNNKTKFKRTKKYPPNWNNSCIDFNWIVWLHLPQIIVINFSEILFSLIFATSPYYSRVQRVTKGLTWPVHAYGDTLVIAAVLTLGSSLLAHQTVFVARTWESHATGLLEAAHEKLLRKQHKEKVRILLLEFFCSNEVKTVISNVLNLKM